MGGALLGRAASRPRYRCTAVGTTAGPECEASQLFEGRGDKGTALEAAGGVPARSSAPTSIRGAGLTRL
eukprot:357704-Chlamydomonas_euryale.AAC.4